MPISACLVDNTPFCKKIMKKKCSSRVSFIRNKPKLLQVKINTFVVVMYRRNKHIVKLISSYGFLILNGFSRSGFPTGVEDMKGGSLNFDGRGSSQYMEGAWGRLKMLSKNTCEGVHLIVKLPAVSLQACKFTEN